MYSFWAVLFVAIITFFGTAHVDASNEPTSVEAEDVPRECRLDDGIGYGRVDVRACPDSTECPVFAPCSNGEGGMCAFWTYSFRWRDDHPRFVALSVSSDVSITSTTPRAVVTPLGQKEPKFGTGKNEFGRRWLRFSAPSDRHHITIETPSRFGFGVAGTAAARGRRIREFCLILTPGARVSEQLQAMTSTVVNEIGCGTITRLVDPMGRTVSIEVPESCVASTTELTNSEGQRVLFATPSSQITFEGSQRDCYQLTNGSWICYTQ
ncbi:hypothetical protein C2W62_10365 [Candidatus Entotheonella serta]|nr:hypothetical protein C2W62_10365 [Candidatus Entotheonella serta]